MSLAIHYFRKETDQYFGDSHGSGLIFQFNIALHAHNTITAATRKVVVALEKGTVSAELSNQEKDHSI